MSRFVVPQFIDEEAKIIGPITGRQFVVMLGALLIEFIFYKLFDFALFLLIGVPFILFALVMAFVKIRGQKFHYFLLNFIQKLRRPALRVWDKRFEEKWMIAKVEEPKKEPPAPLARAPVTSSRLSELSLVVNTGGVYRPED